MTDLEPASASELAEIYSFQVQAVYCKTIWGQFVFLPQAWVEVCHSMWGLQGRELQKR